jgi:hypothetical protein
VIISRRDVLAQNERADHAHHPRQVRAHGEDFLTVEDFLHIPELSYQRGHWALKDGSVIAQLLEERKRIALDLLDDELELLAAISFGSPPFAAIASNSSRMEPPELRAPAFARVASGELSVVVMARPFLVLCE